MTFNNVIYTANNELLTQEDGTARRQNDEKIMLTFYC